MNWLPSGTVADLLRRVEQPLRVTLIRTAIEQKDNLAVRIDDSQIDAKCCDAFPKPLQLASLAVVQFSYSRIGHYHSHRFSESRSIMDARETLST